ncbi:MAG: FAD/NAD(P)-binding protein [Nannocystaceae bacterium]
MSARQRWLIVGGGIHGTHLAIRLLAAGVDRSQLRILDPHARLLERWRVCAENTGMTHLRSPAVHNLDVDAFSLLRFSGPPRGRRAGLFAAPYDRPALGLFNHHNDALVEEHRLAELHVQASARRITLRCDAVEVEVEVGGTSNELLMCDRLILALGVGGQPRWPAWAEGLRGGPRPRAAHVFEEGYVVPGTPPWRRVAVIGGGISAAQVALRLAADPLVAVTVISRHEPRQAQFDSDPGWLGPKHMRAFHVERDLGRRRALIDGARHRGSMPPEVLRALRRALRAGAIEWVRGEVQAADTHPGGVLLRGATPAPIDVDFVLLATGFERRRPGGPLVDRLIADHQLPCAECGYPRIDNGLRWHPQILVSGALAELQLGPVARNIAGARYAADAITRALARPPNARGA